MNIKKICAGLALTMSITASAFVGVMAEEDIVSVSVDNTMVAFDQNPVIIDGYTLVPVRAVFEQAGAKVDWNQDTQTATISKDEYTITIKYGDTALYKNGYRVELEKQATMINNRILIPVRAIAEAMDFAVTWDGHHSLVLISTSGRPYRPFAYLKTGFKKLEDGAEFYTDSADATASIDLDGDGKLENIEFSPAADMFALETPVLKINGLDYTTGLGSLTSVYSIAVADIDNKDNTKEIIVSENGDTLTAHFYRYENGILKVIADGESPAQVEYASRLMLSGTGYIISDLTGICFVDIMVAGGVYKLEDEGLTLYRMRTIAPIFGRNLYNTYDDQMLYHVIYTGVYTQGAYKDQTDTGVISSTDITNFKVIDGYVDPENPRYIEIYVEFPDGSRAVIKPYQT